MEQILVQLPDREGEPGACGQGQGGENVASTAEAVLSRLSIAR